MQDGMRTVPTVLRERQILVDHARATIATGVGRLELEDLVEPGAAFLLESRDSHRRLVVIGFLASLKNPGVIRREIHDLGQGAITNGRTGSLEQPFQWARLQAIKPIRHGCDSEPAVR